ncbi:class I SAM-dependent DNA methyltransferase [Azospirillum halopraeferens]|uniref:class I SAM-dependent DNA methyltransferase n=1 Tax=Azospirillum halopraeferens TaxID=34010 RepID=UPI00041A788B|nr:tetratricopeptide repeat protein [Azospirillum halopraeferens]
MSPRPTSLRASPADRLLAAAGALVAAGRPAEAEAAYRRVVALDPAHARALNDLAGVLDAQAHHGAAVALYRRVLALRYDHPAVHYNLGSALRRAGRPEEAAARLRRALALAPDYADAHNNLGNLLRDADDPAAAVAAYRRAVRLNAGSAPAHENLGSTLYLLHERGAAAADAAARIAADWLAENPDQPLARHTAAALTGAGGEARAPDGYVRVLFDRFAGEFEDRLAELDYRAPALLAAAVAERTGGDGDGGWTVLDAGCGTGLCAPFLRPLARRLEGVDLSPGMLEHARARGLYDALTEAELEAFLAGRPAAFDLIVAADVLCYFGPLDTVLARAAAALMPGGLLAFTVERLADGAAAGDGPGHRLNPNGRYAHAEAHVDGALAAARLVDPRMTRAVLRHEGGHPVEGLVVTARRRT